MNPCCQQVEMLTESFDGTPPGQASTGRRGTCVELVRSEREEALSELGVEVCRGGALPCLRPGQVVNGVPSPCPCVLLFLLLVLALDALQRLDQFHAVLEEVCLSLVYSSVLQKIELLPFTFNQVRFGEIPRDNVIVRPAGAHNKVIACPWPRDNIISWSQARNNQI